MISRIFSLSNTLKTLYCQTLPLLLTADIKENVQNNKRLEKKVSIYLAKKYTGMPLCGIADFYGNLKYKTVSKICERTEKQRKKDKVFDAMLRQIEETIEMSNVET